MTPDEKGELIEEIERQLWKISDEKLVIIAKVVSL